jgi:hypothetical protein
MEISWYHIATRAQKPPTKAEALADDLRYSRQLLVRTPYIRSFGARLEPRCIFGAESLDQ